MHSQPSFCRKILLFLFLFTFTAPFLMAVYGPGKKKENSPPKPEPKIFVETANIIGLNYYDDNKSNDSFDVKNYQDKLKYTIQSTDDKNYQAPQSPKKVGRWSRSYDFSFVGNYGPLFIHTIYLELPYPLEAGKTYLINVKPAVKDKKNELKYLGILTHSPAVKVNQYGYLPDETKKIAYVGDWLGSLGALPLKGKIKSFYLYDIKSKKKVFSGKANPRPIASDMNGEELYELDFSSFKTPGKYLLVVPEVGASYEFEIDKKVYSDIAKMTFRSLYHQRCGIPLEKKYTKWVRPKPCHCQKVEITDLNAFTDGYPNYFKFLKKHATGKFLENAWGGYHDAGDYDRQSRHFIICLRLLQIYEAFKDYFNDNQYNIPESGNGIPDIIDEARWVIDWGIRMQTKDGGIRTMIETEGHPSWGVGPNHPVENQQPLYATKPEPMSSLLFAAPAAQLARVYKEIGEKKEFSYYLKHAVMAYEYAESHKDEMVNVKVDKTAKIKDMWAYAALELYLATGEEKYQKDFLANYRLLKDPNINLASWGDWRMMTLVYSCAVAGKNKQYKMDPKAVAVSLVALKQGADIAASHIDEWGYRVARYNNKIYWGFGGAVDYHEPFLYAYLATGDDKYKEPLVYHADTWLGVNPLGMTWITGAGKHSPVNNLHIPSLNDGIADPVPGISVFGPLSAKDVGENSWLKEYFKMYPDAKTIPSLHSFADVYPFAESNEFRIDVPQIQMISLMLYMDAIGQGFHPFSSKK